MNAGAVQMLTYELTPGRSSGYSTLIKKHQDPVVKDKMLNWCYRVNACLHRNITYGTNPISSLT